MKKIVFIVFIFMFSNIFAQSEWKKDWQTLDIQFIENIQDNDRI